MSLSPSDADAEHAPRFNKVTKSARIVAHSAQPGSLSLARARHRNAPRLHALAGHH